MFIFTFEGRLRVRSKMLVIINLCYSDHWNKTPIFVMFMYSGAGLPNGQHPFYDGRLRVKSKISAIFILCYLTFEII